MFDALKSALESTGIPFAHCAWSKKPSGDYGVWAEDSAQALWADGKTQEQTMQGTVDLFTSDDSGVPKDKVQAALASIDISWYLNSVAYESDTGLMHYEWVFEVV